MNDTALAAAISERHRQFTGMLPQEPADLWGALAEFDAETRFGLFAHCVGLSVNAVQEAWNRRPRALAHADRLAEAVSLDMAARPTAWAPTVDNYLGRVTKPRILLAVREARGEAAAQRIAHLKKGDMAAAAQELLAGSGWLPEPLRTPGYVRPIPAEAPDAEPGTEPAGDGTRDSGEMAEDARDTPAEPIALEPDAIAAE